MAIYWLLLGALIGTAAALRRGFNIAAGALGGALLGPLAFLMFFVSGVASSDVRKKVPYCAEWIRAEASVCKHCGRDVDAKFTTRQEGCGRFGQCRTADPRWARMPVVWPDQSRNSKSV